MPLTYVGELSLGALCPVVATQNAAALTELQARLAGAIQLQASFALSPPSLANLLAAAQQLLSSLEAAIATGAPFADIQIAAAAALITSIEAQIGGFAALAELLATEGVFVFEWSGPTSELGPAVTAALAPGWPDGTPAAAQSNALVLGTTQSAAWTALTSLLGGA